MKTIADLCRPRASVFEDSTTDDVLDITNLLNGTIDADKFFSENFQTQGMKILLETAMERFKGRTDTGVIKLTQAMGGGKTHNMLALALLAKDPLLRERVLGKPDEVGEIKVIAFTGRESDVKFGIWGALAEQMGRKELFTDLYSPLQAPGQSAWVNLFRGQKVLILLDELPPYLENARAVQIGDSNLCRVTVTALSNLFNAVGQADMKNVLLVFSDLRATYQSGTQQLHESFKNLENEANRMARDIAPVALNTDEVYDILKARLFESVPGKLDANVREIAAAYREAAKLAVSGGYANVNRDSTTLADSLATGILEAFPFHPSIKDLYARFKENPNFQQTRGLIRLMRQIVRGVWESGIAEKQSIINAYDVDLNNQRLLAFVREIKPELENAISHDIAQGGRAVAELVDTENQGSHASVFSRLLLMSSLNQSLNGVNGLSERDAFGYLAAPGADLAAYQSAFEQLRLRAWYLKCDASGRYAFQHTKSMVAEISSLVDSYADDFAMRELKKVLQENFAPRMRTCYESMLVFPALDEIRLDMNRVTLIISEPCAGSGLNPQLREFFAGTTFRNRVLFLTGGRDTMERLIVDAKRRTAIASVIETMRMNPNFTETDPQYREATVLLDKYSLALLSAIRETFVTLYYPMRDNQLGEEPITLNFTNNRFDGESIVVNALTTARKYEPYLSDPRKLEVLRQKCEQRLFTQPEMRWEQILDRAATTTSWQLLNPAQMNALRDYCYNVDKWREIGGYLKKGPFPKEPTAVRVEQVDYDEASREFTLRVHGVNATVVYWEVGAAATTASAKVQGDTLKTNATEVFFLAVDDNPRTDERHPTGETFRFLAKVPLRVVQRSSGTTKTMELVSHPDFEIRYTTDGSNPKENGGVYADTISLPHDCAVVLAVVYNHGELIEERMINVDHGAGPRPDVEIDPDRPVVYTFSSRLSLTDTAAVYAEFDLLERFENLRLGGVSITLFDKADAESLVELTTSKVATPASNLRAMLDSVRDGAFAGTDLNLNLSYRRLSFVRGEDFVRYVDAKGFDLNDLAERGTIAQ